jgi:hypothetical protein
MIRIPLLGLSLLGLTLLALSPSAAAAADCPGKPAALNTERVLAIDPAQTAPVGRKQFPRTLPLAPKEIVLTFDDGPLPGTTERVLDALKNECVRATFFMLGRNAAAHPSLAKRVLTEGHTVAHHTYKHPLLNRMPIGRDRPRYRRGRSCCLWRAQRATANTVLSLSGVCFEPRAARSAQGAWHRGVRCGFVARRLEPDDTGARARAVAAAVNKSGRWHRVASRHPAEDGGDAARVVARIEAPRLSRRAYRAGPNALSTRVNVSRGARR